MKDAILAELEKVKGPDHKGEYQARCPFPDHRDTDPSFYVNFDKGCYYCQGCFSKGPISRLANVLGITDFTKTEHRIVAEYSYTDGDGKVVSQTVRYSPKDFRQRRPDGQGGWIWNLDGVTLQLYQLPEVLDAVKKGETVYIVEGEKDVETLRKQGLTATTNPMGAGKWRREYSETLTGADVVIIPDNDDAGRKHAQEVAKSLMEEVKR